MESRRDEIRAWLELRDSEGLTYAELSELSGEARSALSWWSWKLRSEEAANAPTFVEVEVVPDDIDDSVLELRCGEVRIDVRHGFDATLLREVVEALRGC